MAYSSSSGENNFGEYTHDSRPPSSGRRSASRETPARTSSSLHFDILAWYPKHQSCVKYFLDHAQHDVLVQAFASFINILLPYQRQPPINGSKSSPVPVARTPDRMGTSSPVSHLTPATSAVSLIPYLRRLVVTGMDVPQVLHGFFGDDWAAGVGPQREQERRNYLFAAKSGGWASVKRDYDILPLETVPFLRPLQDPTEAELQAAELTWSQWLALEDWMVGSRAPE